MDKTLWQFDTITHLERLLRSLDAVQAAVLVGSFANDAVQPDRWSDLDLVIVIKDLALDPYYADTTWLQPIAPIYTTSRSQAANRFTLRVCFEDLRRLDLIFILASAFESPQGWDFNPFLTGFQVLFSRSAVVDKFLSQPLQIRSDVHDPETQFLSMSNDFWFKGMLAVYKVVRNDLLIALHLTLDLARDCLVLKMMLRDRKTGTRHHRLGGDGNEMIAELPGQSAEYSSTGILKMIEEYSRIFDNLASEWSSSYQAKRFPLLDWIKKAREDQTRIVT